MWNESMCRMYGFGCADGSVHLAEWLQCLHPEDKDRCEQVMQSALQGMGEFDIEFRIFRPDGETRFLKAAARMTRDAHDLPERITGINFDVTERKIAELALVETSALLRTVLDSAAEVSIIATDPGLIIKVFNTGAERLLGYRSEEVVGRVTPSFIYDAAEIEAGSREMGRAPGGRLDDWALFVHPAMLNRPHQWTYVCKDGRRIIVSQVVSAMHTESGGLLGYLSVAHDVTQQRRHEESLRDATERAERASRAKSEFLANMSHEIRTPMNAVIGLSYLLGQTDLDSQQSAVLGNINNASKALLSVINDVLDLSKIEAGGLTIEHAAFSPLELLQQLVDVTTIQANAKGVHFTVDLPLDLPSMLEGDSKHLNQILSNLLTNAVRFTDHGRVELVVALSDRTAHGVTVLFSIRDTGIGISAEAQGRLFAPFAQADSSITRRYGGTGLGLSIVKSLVGLLGGTIQLASTPGIGSEFTVELRLAVAPSVACDAFEQTVPAVGLQAIAGVRVLLVDDSDINLDVTRRILEFNGAQVAVASNGSDAFELLRARPTAYDLVLMDVQMPVLDGHAATKKIRESLALVDLPVVALTAGALSSERQRAVASGMDDFIVKPFDAHTLVSTVLRHVWHKRAAETGGSAATTVSCEIDDGWPVLHGIDVRQARSRLIGDLDLFMSSLRRLLTEFADPRAAVVIPHKQPTVDYAQRMHKLKGTAAMLGATLIEELAARAEAAFKSGNHDEASNIGNQLFVELQRLRDSATTVLAADPVRSNAPMLTTKGKAVGGENLEKLVHMLEAHDLAALDLFNSMAASLRHHLGRRGFERVRDLVDQLLLTDAAKALGKPRT